MALSNKKNYTIAALVLCLTVAATARATPIQLGGYTFVLAGLSQSNTHSDNVWFNTYIDSTLLFSSEYDITSLPASFNVTLTDSDSGFLPAEQLLTNGIDDSIKAFNQIGFNLFGSVCCGPESSESNAFFPHGGGPDFQGDTITSINITVYDISGGISGTNATLAYDESFVVDGYLPTAAPEPADVALCGTGLLALALIPRVRAHPRKESPPTRNRTA